MWFSKKKYSDRIRTQQAIFFDVLSVSNLYFFYVFGTENSRLIPTKIKGNRLKQAVFHLVTSRGPDENSKGEAALWKAMTIVLAISATAEKYRILSFVFCPM